jgi:hypothetical protein
MESLKSVIRPNRHQPIIPSFLDYLTFKTFKVFTHDSWVEAEFPNGNHGSETSLRVKSDSRTRRSYLKFDLNSIQSGKSVASVKLYLYCTYKSWDPSVGIYVHETGDSWDEASKEYDGTAKDPYLEVTYEDAPPTATSYEPFKYRFSCLSSFL